MTVVATMRATGFGQFCGDCYRSQIHAGDAMHMCTYQCKAIEQRQRVSREENSDGEIE